MPFSMKELAYCGLYCPQCSFRVTYETSDKQHLLCMPEHYDRLKSRTLDECACEGCKGKNICGPCKIKDCAAGKGFDTCAECAGFPCETLAAFFNDGMPHHGMAGENLRLIRETGLAEWYARYAEKWGCERGEKRSWYENLYS